MATLDDINTLPDARFLSLDDMIVIAEQDDRRSPKKISVGQLKTLIVGNPARGQISVQNNSTATDVVLANTFYEAGINGTLDAATTVNFTANTNSTFGMKYTGTDTRIFWFYGSFDCANGNNDMLAIRMAKNGTTIPATECRAFTGGNQNEAKLVTSWMIELAHNDVVTLLVSNVDHTTDITVKRGRLVANAIS
jgi:hypothetical protein